MVWARSKLKPGTPIVTLTDLDNLYVDFTLPEQTRADLKVGQTVEIRVDAFKGRVFQAKLTTIEPQLDPEMRSIKVQGADIEHFVYRLDATGTRADIDRRLDDETHIARHGIGEFLHIFIVPPFGFDRHCAVVLFWSLSVSAAASGASIRASPKNAANSASIAAGSNSPPVDSS